MLHGFLWLTAACGFVLSLMVLLCSEAGAAFLQYALERQSAPIEERQLREVQAIVVLGGRTDRVHYAAALHRKTGLPLVLTGKGSGENPYVAESLRMEEILRDQYDIRPRWVEGEALDTVENAVFTACLLEGSSLRWLALVTDPAHMPRSLALFEAAGFKAVAAPAPYGKRDAYRVSFDSFVPSSDGLEAARPHMKEWTGRFLEPLSVLLRRGECSPRGAVH